jgi:hypothetical protein
MSSCLPIRTARFYERDTRVHTVSYARVRQPVNARGLGRWKAYATELAPLIGELEKAGLIAADKTQGKMQQAVPPKSTCNLAAASA